jgi:Na+/H+ antiporter NhaD/arsenite permease-like protein
VIPPGLIAPFVLLLALIAVMPLAPPWLKHRWERYYAAVALGLGALVVIGVGCVPGGAHLAGQTAEEYVSFICLIGSLFVVAGGIHVRVRGEATPIGNVTFLAIGGGLANLVGTTGASMVLIRPYLRMNRTRIRGYHVVFFIFVVANIGGALTPIGDPPLFLGFLRGIPFFWLLEHVMLEWLATLGAVLAVFYVIDRHQFRRIPPDRQRAIAQPDQWRFDGTANVLLLLVIIGAVFLPAAFFLRELVMLIAAAVSYRLTPRAVHDRNGFSLRPIKEVAILFAGIFATMMPALNYLDVHGDELGFHRPQQYYFAAGSLSAVLDNAPTYLNFLKLAEVSAAGDDSRARPALPDAAESPMQRLLVRRPDLVIAVSLGAVFFGAMTYIGNGPNFMVKSIAESAGVPVPGFLGYLLRYSLPILLPILIGVGWLFL